MTEDEIAALCGGEKAMARVRKAGVRIPLRERAELARTAFQLHEAGLTTWMIAVSMNVSEPTVLNLIGYGRRLAAGQPEVLEWR